MEEDNREIVRGISPELIMVRVWCSEPKQSVDRIQAAFVFENGLEVGLIIVNCLWLSVEADGVIVPAFLRGRFRGILKLVKALEQCLA